MMDVDATITTAASQNDNQIVCTSVVNVSSVACIISNSYSDPYVILSTHIFSSFCTCPSHAQGLHLRGGTAQNFEGEHGTEL